MCTEVRDRVSADSCHTHIRLGPRDGRNVVPLNDCCHVEVCEVNVALGIEKHVCRFDVTMDDLLCSEIVQCQTELGHVQTDPTHLKPPLLLQVVAEVTPWSERGEGGREGGRG